MGWTYMKTNMTPKECIRYYVEGGNSTYRLLDLAIVAKQEAYLAVQNTLTGKTMAWVFLLDTKSKNGFNFGYKDMDESMEPFYYRCPKRILDVLSPVEDIYEHESSRLSATKWRETCRTNLARREAVKSLRSGDHIRLKTDITFSDGVTRSTFLVKKMGRTFRFVGEDGIACRISRLAEVGFETVAS